MASYTAKKIGEMETFYKGLFRKARAEVGVESFGLAVIELEPNADNHPNHDHASEGQEEVFVVMRGSGEMEVDGERFPIDPETVVRVGPTAKRRIHPGPEGMRLLAIGGVPGSTYDAPAYTERGAPDPLGD
jgi:mannose-6-phosphate isomerase-like protein (cupin superfamily)